MNTHIYIDSRKMALINRFAGYQWRHREQTYEHSVGRSGWDKLREYH